MNNKRVFTQDELPSILQQQRCKIKSFLSHILPSTAATPTPAQQVLPAMGVLQKVAINSETVSYNFIHLSIQEMLAAYRISRMENDQQVRVFQTLLGEPRFAAVLQFYAGFTELANHGVRKVITCNFCTYNDAISKISRLTHLRCFFEAQIYNQWCGI